MDLDLVITHEKLKKKIQELDIHKLEFKCWFIINFN